MFIICYAIELRLLLCTLFPYTTLFRSGIIVNVDRARIVDGIGPYPIIKIADVDIAGEGKLKVGTCGPDEFKAEITVRSDRKSTRLNSSHSQISYAVF